MLDGCLIHIAGNVIRVGKPRYIGMHALVHYLCNFCLLNLIDSKIPYTYLYEREREREQKNKDEKISYVE